MPTTKASFFEKASAWIRQSIFIRLFTIGILILLLMIPVAMIQDLIYERERRQADAIAEVSAKWGERQTVTGPVLTVPYKTVEKVYTEGNDYKLVESVKYAHFLPDILNIGGEIFPEERYRGIFKVIVYNARVNISGSFPAPRFDDWNIDDQNIMWEDAFVSLGLTDLRSIQDNIAIKWNGEDLYFNPGVETRDVIQSGISVRLASRKDPLEGARFSIDLNFNGSGGLYFIPLGKRTEATLKSEWQDPSFDGAFLPDSREVGGDGFSAFWEILHLNRSYPQSFRGSVAGVYESEFGVNLLVPVDEYQKSMRSAKYSVIFIALTFLIFFFVQILNRVRIHPIQYLIVGLALCVFYTLLIALSEHIPFNVSYLIAGVSIVSLITFYAHSIFKSKTLTWLMCLILVLLYMFIFSIIQMEDYALLMGSLGLFLVLAIVMFLSRKINWYEIRTEGDGRIEE